MRDRARGKERERGEGNERYETESDQRDNERERADGWVKVRTRKREGLRDRKDPGRSYAGHSLVRQTTWRERPDISSFYFTRFPEEANEKDLWVHFKKWGQVREVFISKHRNKGGRRYGSVRFSVYFVLGQNIVIGPSYFE